MDNKSDSSSSSPLPLWRKRLAVGVVVIGVACFLYHVLVRNHLEQTALLFVGLPCFIAVSLILLARPSTHFGSIMLWMTVALLLSGPLLGEGFICILMAAPLFYAFGALVWGCLAWGRPSKPGQDKSGRYYALGLVPLALMSLEGINEALSFPREETIVVERTIDATPERVRANLGRAPELPGELPPFLRLGFPQVVEATGSGLRVGDTRRLHFAGGEGKPGDLVLEVTEVTPNAVTFTALSDTSHIAHWLDWREMRFAWTPRPDGRCDVRVTLRYDRRLDPAWYFGPFQRYAMRLTGGYMLENLTTPPPS